MWQTFNEAGELMLETDNKEKAIASIASLDHVTRIRWRLKKLKSWNWYAVTHGDLFDADNRG